MKAYGRLNPLVTIAIVGLALIAGTWPLKGFAAESVSFKEDVFPIIQVRCLMCHVPGGQGYEASGLDLRTYEGIMKGTKHGPIVVPGNAFTSNLMVLIEGRAKQEIRMPHNRKKLSKCEKDIFRRWINRGAKND